MLKNCLVGNIGMLNKGKEQINNLFIACGVQLTWL